MTHKNGARALSDLVLLVTEPESYADKYAQLTGQKARRDDKRWRIELPLVSRLTFIGPNDIGAGSRARYSRQRLRLQGSGSWLRIWATWRTC